MIVRTYVRTCLSLDQFQKHFVVDEDPLVVKTSYTLHCFPTCVSLYHYEWVVIARPSLYHPSCSGGTPGEDPLLEQGPTEEQGDRLPVGEQAWTERASVTSEVS